ncbi:MAG: DUF2911 domain-containing protein [Bryobacteraceae bacterium]|nr:DUF2911 domain-containing protein [Bryobacteraceae bacterium]
MLSVCAGALYAQFPPDTLPTSGNNQRALVTQFIGPVKVSIDYSSPAVTAGNGQDRRGKIWGQLVPYGLTDLGFGHRKPSPWRAGANENTVFEVSHPVQIGGKPLPAGRYGLHMIVDPNEWTLILSRNSTSWGSFFYEESEDALRVKLKPRKNEHREYLTYEFTERKPDEATVELQWESIAVPWTIRVDKINEIYLTKIREQLRTTPGFTWQGWLAAAQFGLTANPDTQETLRWADTAVAQNPGFATLDLRSQVLAKLGREADAKAAMEQAVNHPTTTVLQLHQYGRRLMAQNKNAEAMAIFQLNAKRNGDTWPVHVGLARGYQALGDKAKALEHAKKALAQAPDKLNRDNLENMVKTLSGTGGQ